jgi:hypothetical protein
VTTGPTTTAQPRDLLDAAEHYLQLLARRRRCVVGEIDLRREHLVEQLEVTCVERVEVAVDAALDGVTVEQVAERA